MDSPRPAILLPAMVIALGTTLLVLASCVLGPSGPRPAGARELLMEVENQSAFPATLMVARDDGDVGALIGQAIPDVIPAGGRSQLLLVVPPSDEWVLFVNPQRGSGPLITAHDVRRCSGRLPIVVIVGRDGSPGWSTRGHPCLDL